MPSGRFNCQQCGRSFSMAAHLGRHMKTIHGKQMARASAPKRKVGRPKGSKNRRSLGGAPWAGLAAGNGASQVLSAMQAYQQQLASERMALDAKMAAINTALATMGGTAVAAAPAATGRKRGRPAGRPGSLKFYIANVLRQASGPMGPKEIAAAVQKAGYRTKAKELTKAVSNTLPQIKGVKKRGFGQYTL
ncbi:MAG: C2H2-type zinc finger protein [Planctomycetes bacterium]|nr:C2H2-type zinc finger protein [Planctomycetota bacterium]